LPLRTLVSDDELRLVEAALRWIDSASKKAFALLFEERDEIPMPPGAIALPLLAFDLVERTDGGIRGRLRVRRHAGRFYVLELGIGSDDEYQQDLWPETDALLLALEGLAPCRILDLGTGCGIVAVEAALRGHNVVATDVYQPTMVLARFNARLNQANVEFRQGHLWEPVAGERFDRVLTNPHYGHADDQLRLEVLRGATKHLTADGKLLLATALEWDEAERPRRLGVDCVLQPIAETGHAVTVRPLVSATKRSWFAVARGAAKIPSRHRFTVEIARAPKKLDVKFPEHAPEQHFVPLSRLSSRGQHATVTTPADAARLENLLTDDDAMLPAGLLDDCRWGARDCVGPRGAAGAVVTPDGKVRPCAHGPALATCEETLDELNARYADLAAQARARRGCDACPADAACSHCLFPVALDDAGYCALIVKHHARLPLLHRRIAGLPRESGST
jgi:2-polyprenyl-3-methyl-5-hydroxy-6-metoxy-1,4-benzoquinol methylase